MGDDGGRPAGRWAPPIGGVIAAAGGAVAFALAAAMVGRDAAGVLLLSIAAVLLALIAGNWALVRPRLVLETTATGPRITVRTVTGAVTLTPAQIHRLRVVRYSRLGRKVPILEIDARHPEDRLLMLTRWDLGASPDAVLAVLAEAGMV